MVHIYRRCLEIHIFSMSFVQERMEKRSDDHRTIPITQSERRPYRGTRGPTGKGYRVTF